MTTSRNLSTHPFLFPIRKFLCTDPRMAIPTSQRGHPYSLITYTITIPIVSDRRTFSSRPYFPTPSMFHRHPRTRLRITTIISLRPIGFRTNHYSTTETTRCCHYTRIRRDTINRMPLPPSTITRRILPLHHATNPRFFLLLPVPPTTDATKTFRISTSN